MIKLVVRSLLGILVVFTVGKLFIARNGLFQQIEIKQKNEELRKGNDSLRALITTMEKTRNRLLKDSTYMEETARTRFGMSRPGESVYYFLDAQDSEPRKASTQPASSPGSANQGVTVTRPE